MRQTIYAAILGIAIALVGCATTAPYSSFYRGEPDGRTLPGYADEPSSPRIVTTTDHKKDLDDYMRRGYTVLGEVAFSTGSPVDERDVIAQAQKVGASLVLTANKYTHTVNTAIPMTVPTTSTSYSTGSATAYGAGGTTTAYGNTRTTTRGTATTYVPISVDRSQYNAVFLARTKPRLGLYVEDTSDDTKRRIGTNTGIVVTIVIQGSPAFASDVLPGDILMAINGDPMLSTESFGEALEKVAPQGPVTLQLLRDGRPVEKRLQLAR